MVGNLHHALVFQRRISALAAAISGLLAPGLVLDIGCGNGMLASLLMSMRSDIRIIGLDEHMRLNSPIPGIHGDGSALPFANQQFSSVLIVDVLHHTDDPALILRESLRVTRDSLIIKDHFYETSLEYALLCGLDWVGNASHGVRLNYNYFTRSTWLQTLQRVGAVEKQRQEVVEGMYPQPFQMLLGQRIQFIARLSGDEAAS